jgi:hypothetical protein
MWQRAWIRYTGGMTNAWPSLAREFDDALRLLEAAVLSCPDALWEVDLWPEEAPTAPGPHGGLHGSAPWFLAYHALTCLDYDLTGDFEPWSPPQPFDDNTWSWPNRVFTNPEVLGYTGYCRERARRTLGELTDEAAARPLPPTHRYAGTLYGTLLRGIPAHTIEHATQIRRFADQGRISPV